MELGSLFPGPGVDGVSLHVLAGGGRHGATLAITLVELLFFPKYFESTTFDPVTIGIAVTLGWCGNSLYRTHVVRQIDKLRPSATSRESLLALLEAQGGTNWLAAAGFAIATPLLGFLIYIVAGTY